MPELPEVETTKNGLELLLSKKTITKVEVLNPNLRWYVDSSLLIHRLTIRQLNLFLEGVNISF